VNAVRATNAGRNVSYSVVIMTLTTAK